MSEEIVKAPALGISIQSTAGGHQIVFQTHVDQATSKEELDKLTDRFIAVANRQQAKSDLIELEKNREVQIQQLENLRADRARIDMALAASAEPNNGRRTARISPTEEKAREQSVVMEDQLIKVLKRFETQIKETQAIIGQ